MRVPVPVPGPGPFCPPRRLPLRPLFVRRRRRAPPPRRRGSGHPRRLRPWRGGGWLVLGSGGSGGDEVSCVGVDVVEVGVVVALLVAVVRRHLLDAGGNAPHRLYGQLRGRPAPRPPPFAPPSPRGSGAPSCLSPEAQVALAVAHGSLPGPHAFVSLSTPWVPPTVTCALPHTARQRTYPSRARAHALGCPHIRRLGPAPLHALRCRPPWRPARAPACPSCTLALSLLRVPRRAVRFACSVPSAAAGLGALRTPLPSLLAACARACPRCLSLGTPPVASRPPLRVPVAGTLPRLRAVPPLPDHALGVLLPPQLRQRDAWRRTLGCRGGDGPRPSRWEGVLWGVRLGGAGVGVAGVGVGAVLRALPALRCSCGGSRRGAWGPRLGHPPRWWRAGGRGRGRGVACWGCGLSSLRAWGPLWGQGGRARGLGGRGGLLSRRRSPG